MEAVLLMYFLLTAAVGKLHEKLQCPNNAKLKSDCNKTYCMALACLPPTFCYMFATVKEGCDIIKGF